MITRRWLIALTTLSMALSFAGAFSYGYRATLNQLVERGENALVLFSERLTLQLARHRYLPAILASEPVIRSVLSPASNVEEANRFMQQIADTSGALDIYVIDKSGTTVAASNWNLSRSFIGENYEWRPYFRRAILGGLGFYHAVGVVSGQRGFYFAHPILSDDKEIAGVIVVKIDLERIESQWRGDQQNLFFSDKNGVVFLSNRPSLVLRKLDQRAIEDPRQYADRTLEMLEREIEQSQSGAQIWRDIGLPGFPGEALFLSRYLPTLELDANTLMDLGPARAQGLLTGVLAGLVVGLIWLMAAVALQRRATLDAQLRIEETARNLLEDKVAERTSELEQVQAQLVQAGKLTALGEMSAGISHELNQPLTAIQSLADNAEVFVQREDLQGVRSNVERISQLAGRMGRIIRNLRSFARNEAEEVTKVDLAQVLHDALAIAAPKLKQSGAKVQITGGDKPVFVRGGRVRLQQVLVNLISNAADAMDGQTHKQIDLDILRSGTGVQMRVRDTGPGLAEPERVFDPFYTTKTVGEGLGLGLSISYGIVQSFGGDITGSNHPEGGAVFEIALQVPQKGQ